MKQGSVSRKQGCVSRKQEGVSRKEGDGSRMEGRERPRSAMGWPPRAGARFTLNPPSKHQSVSRTRVECV